jgi:hypothetical protein
MQWVRHHDKYESGELLDADKPYWPKTAEPQGGGCCHSASTAATAEAKR